MEESKVATPNNVKWVEFSVIESNQVGSELRSNNLPKKQAKALVHHINKTNPNIGASHETLESKEGVQHKIYVKNVAEFMESFPVADVKLKSHADSHIRSGPKAISHKRANAQLQTSVNTR